MKSFVDRQKMVYMTKETEEKLHELSMMLGLPGSRVIATLINEKHNREKRKSDSRLKNNGVA